MIFSNACPESKCLNLIVISLKFVCKGIFGNKSALVQVTTRCCKRDEVVPWKNDDPVHWYIMNCRGPVLSLTWELPYLVRPSFLLRRPPGLKEKISFGHDFCKFTSDMVSPDLLLIWLMLFDVKSLETWCLDLLLWTYIKPGDPGKKHSYLIW